MHHINVNFLHLFWYICVSNHPSILSSSYSINQATDLAGEEHLFSFEMGETLHLFFSKLLFEKFA